MRSQPNPDPFLLTKAPNPLPFRGSDPFLVITPHQCYLFSSRPSLPLQGDSCLHRKRISDTIPSAKSVFSRISFRVGESRPSRRHEPWQRRANSPRSTNFATPLWKRAPTPTASSRSFAKILFMNGLSPNAIALFFTLAILRPLTGTFFAPTCFPWNRAHPRSTSFSRLESILWTVACPPISPAIGHLFTKSATTCKLYGT